VFSIKGRGTVATGRVERGKVKMNDAVDIVGFTKDIRKSVVTGIEAFQKTPAPGGIFCATTQPLAKNEPAVVEIYFPDLPNRVLVRGTAAWWRRALPRQRVRVRHRYDQHVEQARDQIGNRFGQTFPGQVRHPDPAKLSPQRRLLGLDGHPLVPRDHDPDEDSDQGEGDQRVQDREARLAGTTPAPRHIPPPVVPSRNYNLQKEGQRQSSANSFDFNSLQTHTRGGERPRGNLLLMLGNAQWPAMPSDRMLKEENMGHQFRRVR
jgi:hypothetical protein